MSLIITGTLVDVSERNVTPDPSKGHTWAAFVERQLHVLDGRSVHHISVGKDFRGDVASMKQGQQVALQVSIRCYPKNNGTAADFAMTAWEDLSARYELKPARPAVAS
jgi:hypothetical protein